MEPYENGNSLTAEQLKKIDELIVSIINFDKTNLNRIVDIPLENESIFWETASEVVGKIEYDREDLRPHMRVMPPRIGKFGTIFVFLKSIKTKRRDILLVVFTKKEKNRQTMFLGTIYDKSIYSPSLKSPSEYNATPPAAS